MSTQLRLVENLPPPTRAKQNRTNRNRTATRTASPSRRAVQWGDWRLDARTRTVGRAGVAAARRALEEAAAADQLSQAS